MDALGLSTRRLSEICGVSSPRISQVTKGGDYPPPELMWKIVSALQGEEEYAAMDEDQIRAVLERIMVSLGPRRMIYLASLSSSTGQAMIDLHEATQRSITDAEKPPWESEK